MHRYAPKARIVVVTKKKTVVGYITDVHTLESVQLPFRVAKRRGHAHKAGLAYVRALGTPKPLTMDETGVIAVTVTDGRRALASWRRMERLGGFTGTHDVHPLVAASLIR